MISRKTRSCGPLALRRGPLALLALATVLGAWLAGCSGTRPRRAQDLVVWAEGPVRWLLLSEERRQIDNIKSATEAGVFIDIFWGRRDPDPAIPGNTFLRRFRRRVSDAEQLYGEPGVSGGLVDRGGALILFGAPSRIRVTSRPALSWSPESGDPHRSKTRDLQVEIWSYAPDELPRGVLERLGATEQTDGISLTFVTSGGRTYLNEGEGYLRHAARAAVGIEAE